MEWMMLAAVVLSVFIADRAGIWLARPPRKRSGAVTETAVAREPRDTSRPFLSSRAAISPGDERLRTCPVCGMEDPAYLTGDFMGWPAHPECIEWLGEWKPPMPASVLPALPGNLPQPVSRSAEPVPLAREWTLDTGAITLDELRERIPRMWCTCGKEFSGTPAGIRAMDAHQRSGECPHSARHRR